MADNQSAAAAVQDENSSGLSTLEYMSFGALGHTPWMIVPSFSLAFIASIGVIMNSSVIFVTIRSKNLRGTCQYLLALTCVGEVMHQPTHIIYFGVTLTKRFIPLIDCAHIQLPSMFGVFCVQTAIACTALDRCFATYKPILYKQMNDRSSAKALYLFVHTTTIVVASACTVLLIVRLSEKYARACVPCDIADVLTMPDIYSVFIGFTYSCNVVAILLYALVFIVVRKHVQGGDVQTRLFRSLFTIVCVNIGGYLVNLGLMDVYMLTLANNVKLMWICYNVNGVMLNVCAAMNAPILNWMCSDYREAFAQHLGPLRCMLCCGSVSAKSPLFAHQSNVFVRRSDVECSRNRSMLHSNKERGAGGVQHVSRL